ncbi:MAG TPA: hypothetical protein VMZ11_05995 [Mycobacteriales bacterium]|nr:hypothetical protein [Mycobacteriales bacterium]
MTLPADPVSRPPLLLLAGSAVVVSGALMGLAHWAQPALLTGTAVLQVLLVLGFLALVEAPAAGWLFALGVAAAAAGDVVVQLDDGSVADLAGVAALALVAGLLLQLLRRQRDRVTESLADTMVAVLLVSSAACLPAVLEAQQGEALLRVGLLAAGAGLVVVRLASLVLRRFALAPDTTRGWAGLVLALAVAVAVAVPEAGDHLADRDAMLVGLAAAATAVLADLFVDLASAEVQVRRDDRRVHALSPVAWLLPFALVGPVLLVAARLLERA